MKQFKNFDEIREHLGDDIVYSISIHTADELSGTTFLAVPEKNQGFNLVDLNAVEKRIGKLEIGHDILNNVQWTIIIGQLLVNLGFLYAILTY